MRIARRVFFGQNLYIIEQTVSFANVFTKNRFKKNNCQSFLDNQNYKLYIICVLVISNLFHILRWLFSFFSTKSFWLPFCIKTFPALQGSNEAPWGRAFWGAVRHESAACATKPEEPTNGLGKSPCWEIPPPKKWVKFGWALFFPIKLFSHPTFVFSRVFIAGLVESGMESLYEHVHNAGKARSRNNQRSIGRLCHPELQQIHHT